MQHNNNPCGLDGFAFLEFSGPDKTRLHQQFTDMGFQATANHKNQDITLFQQGQIQFIVNAATNCQAEEHAKTHGSGACAMGFRVKMPKQHLTTPSNTGLLHLKIAIMLIMDCPPSRRSEVV